MNNNNVSLGNINFIAGDAEDSIVFLQSNLKVSKEYKTTILLSSNVKQSRVYRFSRGNKQTFKPNFSGRDIFVVSTNKPMNAAYLTVNKPTVIYAPIRETQEVVPILLQSFSPSSVNPNKDTDNNQSDLLVNKMLATSSGATVGALLSLLLLSSFSIYSFGLLVPFFASITGSVIALFLFLMKTNEIKKKYLKEEQKF